MQIATKRREVKGKGEKKRYNHLNAEFQRIARRDKKAFLSDQGKEIKRNNRMGKTRDLFKKIRDTKGTFHANMDTIKATTRQNVSAQSCLTLCDPMDCSLLGSSIYGILQGIILEWLPFPSPGDHPYPGIEPRFPALKVNSLPSEPPGKP